MRKLSSSVLARAARARRLAEERRSQAEGINPVLKSQKDWDLTKVLDIAPQLAFASDTAKRIAACTSRRAGKSTACTALLLDRAMRHPRTNHYYITETRVDAKELIWDQLKYYLEEYRVRVDVSEQELNVRLPNRSMIRLRGAKDDSEVRKLRGREMKTAIVDEAQNFPEDRLRVLLDDIIEPSMWKCDGALYLTGTPGWVPFGTFYDISSGALPGWSRHAWTAEDNHHIGRVMEDGTVITPAQVLEESRRSKGLELDSPTYLREYRGLWVKDDSLLVVDFDPRRNKLPHHDVPCERYYIGVDIGFNDADAIAVVGVTAHGDKHLVYEYKERGNTNDALFAEVKRLHELYKPVRIVADHGGLGTKIIETWNSMSHGFRIHDAQKKGTKYAAIELLNNELRCGRFFADPRGPFGQEARMTVWDEKAMARGERKVSDRYHPDMLDAVIYAVRETLSYSGQTLLLGSNTEEKIRREHFDKVLSRNQKAWWKR